MGDGEREGAGELEAGQFDQTKLALVRGTKIVSLRSWTRLASSIEGNSWS
jgi:hypothetical protein